MNQLTGQSIGTSLRDILVPEHYSDFELHQLIDSGALIGRARCETEALIQEREVSHV